MRVLVAVDQVANAILGGQSDETISAKTYRMARKTNEWKWIKLEKIINNLMGSATHCHDAYQAEVDRTQISNDYSKK